MKLRNALATIAVTIALVTPAAMIATATPNADPTLSGISTQLRDLADQIDAYAPTTTTTVPPPTTTTVAPTTTTTVPVVTRDARLWPFRSTDPFNTPLGDQAAFDTRALGPTPNINTLGYGVTINGAGYSSPAQHDGVENHITTIQPDGVSVLDYIGVPPVKNGGPYDIRTSAIGAGTGASHIGRLAGVLRQDDMVNGIRHALKLSLPGSMLKKGWVWPAQGQDASTSDYAGFVPIGSLVGIPRSATMPTGMSPAGQKVWTALRTYGGYVTDRGGAIMAEATADAAVNPARADMSKIWSQVRMVTNSTPTNIGGPGARLAPVAPPIG